MPRPRTDQARRRHSFTRGVRPAISLSLGFALVVGLVGGVSPAASAATTITVTSTDELRNAAAAGACDGTISAPRVIIIGSDFGILGEASVTYLRCHLRVDLNGHTLKSGPMAIGEGYQVTIMSSQPQGRLTTQTPAADYYRAGIRTTNAQLTLDGIYVSAGGGYLSAGIGGGGRQGRSLGESGEDGGTLIVTGGARVFGTTYGRGAGIGGGAGSVAQGIHDNGVGRGGSGGIITISGTGSVLNGSSDLGAGIGGGNGNRSTSGGGGGRGGVGGTVTVTDGGRAVGTSNRGAGIGGGAGTGYGTTYAGQGGHLIVESGTVEATSYRGSGVGGGDASEYGSHGGKLTIHSGGVVKATSTLDGSGFGHGRLGGGGQSGQQVLTVHDGGILNASSKSGSAIGLGAGSATIGGVLNVLSSTLLVNSANFTVTETGQILGTGTDPSRSAQITGNGTITNYGVIALSSVNPTVKHNNFQLRFTPTSGSAVTVRLLAPTFNTGYRDIPTLPPGFEWNSAADGSGDRLSYTTRLVPSFMSTSDHAANTGTRPIQLYQVASEEGDYELSLDLPSASVTAGEPFEATASITHALTGEPVDDHDPVTLTFTRPDATVGNDGRITATVAGALTVSATTSYEGEELSASGTVMVAPAVLHDLRIDPAQAHAAEDDTIAFDVQGEDAYGNPIILDPTEVSLSSDSSSDSVNGLEVTFGVGGERTITAEHTGGLTAAATIAVLTDQTRYELRILGATNTVVAGEPFLAHSEIYDLLLNDEVLEPLTATWTLSDPHASITADGEILATRAGVLTIMADVQFRGIPLQAQAQTLVEPAEAAHLTLTPSAASVFEDVPVTFTVSATDAYGNPVDTEDVELSSSRSTDAFTAWQLQMTELGARTITAELESASATATITLLADPSRYELRLDTGPSTAIAGIPFSATPTVIDTTTDTPVAPQPSFGWTFSSPDAITSAVDEITATRAGSLTLSVSAAYKGLTLRTSGQMDISPAPLHRLELLPGTASILDGRTVVYTVTGTDAFGNSRDVSTAALTSSASSDRVSDRTVTVTGAGSRTITASLDGVTATAPLHVTAPPAPIPVVLVGPDAAAGNDGEPSDPDAGPGSGVGNGVDSGLGSGVEPGKTGPDTPPDVPGQAGRAAEAPEGPNLGLLLLAGGGVLLVGLLGFLLLWRRRANQ